MEICKKKIIKYFFLTLLLIFVITPSYSEQSFEKISEKQVSFLEFFLLKFESQLIRRSQFLRRQMFATRVQYSNVGIEVEFDKKDKKIIVDVYAIMDKHRYSKKNYRQKISDCNQVRNLILYKKHGYKFFTQKRDPYFSQSIMKDIFKEVFFHNLDFNEGEENFLLDNIFINVTIYHPVKKLELSCAGKINDYELK